MDRASPHAGEPALVPFGNGQFSELAWRQPRVFARRWELVSERGAHLVLARPGGLGMIWHARGASGSWAIERRPWSRVMVARPESGGEPIVTITRRWLGIASVTLASGEQFRWRHDLFRARFRLDDEAGHAKIEFARRFRWFRHEADVAIEESFRGRSDLAPLLAALWRAAAYRPHHAH